MLFCAENIIPAGVLALLFLIATSVAASPASKEITREKATRIALRAVPGGRATEVERDRDPETGRWIYEVEVIDPEHHEHEIIIDARTGEVLSEELDD